MTEGETNKELRKRLTAFVGRRKITKRKPQIQPVNAFPIRGNALGKSGGGKQGVAGWRRGYYRTDVDLAPQTVTVVSYPEETKV